MAIAVPPLFNSMTNLLIHLSNSLIPKAMRNNLMHIVAEHGTGNDILELANLLRSAGNNVPHTPITKVKHNFGNVYECLGFTPNDTFGRMAEIEQSLPNAQFLTEKIEAMLKDQQTTEQMAILAVLFIAKLPTPMIGMLLGGQSE